MLIGNSFGESKTGASFIRGNEYFSKQNEEPKEKIVKQTPKQAREQDQEEEEGQIGTSSSSSDKEDSNESQPEENDP